jgi:CheY-like chemotaxis protein
MGISARKAVLEELGFSVAAATSAADGLKRFSERSFDLVVTDYKMPKMNGARFIAEVRKLRPEVPIILLSGFTDALGLDEKTTGADLVIQKSADEVNLMLRGVRRLLRASALKKPAGSQRRTTKSHRKTG